LRMLERGVPASQTQEGCHILEFPGLVGATPNPAKRRGFTPFHAAFSTHMICSNVNPQNRFILWQK
jgi:hypothetical protein